MSDEADSARADIQPQKSGDRMMQSKDDKEGGIHDQK
jgi:hypothetical protein